MNEPRPLTVTVCTRPRRSSRIVGLLLGLAAVPAAVGVLWAIDWAAGTRWAFPVAALICLPILAVTFRNRDTRL